MKQILLTVVFAILLTACGSQNEAAKNQDQKNSTMLSKEAIKVRNYLKKNMVIAHRGSTYWAPEETEPAFRWARNIGADYLEFDVQMTKDSVLVALHDNTLSRTSNVAEVFPHLSNPTTKDLTLKQLRSLDFGGWFNKKYPERARKKYEGLTILTLKDVIMIAEGYRLIRVDGQPAKEVINNKWTGRYLYEKDPHDNYNRPGLYIETKKNHLEELLLKGLKNAGWLVTDHPKKIKTYSGKVAVGNSKARVVLQSFHRRSIEKFNTYLPGIPKCLLVNSVQMLGFPKTFYRETLEFCVRNRVEIIGPDIKGIKQKKQKSSILTDLIHDTGMLIHTYTFNTTEEFEEYAPNIDGVFTNRADLALLYYKRLKTNISEEILKELEY